MLMRFRSEYVLYIPTGLPESEFVDVFLCFGNTWPLGLPVVFHDAMN